MKKYIFYALLYLTLITNAHAGIIYESATGSFDSSNCCGSNIMNNQFIGAVFSVNQTINVDGIGGHFNNYPAYPYLGFGGTIFGAIVSLNNNPPYSGGQANFDSLIAHSVFTPNSGLDSLASISATLSPGTYGLVFGTGFFGATGKSTLTLIQPYSADTSNGRTGAVTFSNGFSSGRVHLFDEPNRYRMFVTGTVVSSVPEPKNYGMLLAGLGVVGFAARRKNTRVII